MNDIEKRKRIIEITNDKNILSHEKNRLIQELMTSKLKNIKIECNHYEKKCNNFYFECCDTYYDCHRCHNENSECIEYKIKFITCSECYTKQNISNICISCNIEFSNCYCSKCLIWTSKKIHHCDKCKICRIGSEEELYHCDSCCICFEKKNMIDHKCVKIPFNSQICSYCLESTFTSQESSIVIKCGHIVHLKCLENAKKNNNYKCPNCRKSLYDMKLLWNNLRNNIEMQPMPSEFFEIKIGDIVNTKYGDFIINNITEENICEGEFIKWKKKDCSNVKGFLNRENLKKNTKVKILCNDCDLESMNEFHFIGVECILCNSFNTTII